MKKLYKIIGTSVLAALALLSISPQAANAVSGQTNLTVDIPPFLVLYYPAALRINLADKSTVVKDEQLFEFDEAGDLSTILTTSSAEFIDTIYLEVPNIWAIRGVTASGNAKVHIGPSEITLTDAVSKQEIKVAVPIVNGKGDEDIVALSGSLPVFGKIGMTISLGGLNVPGSKTGSFTGGFYEMTVTSL